jgi:hypothetical protein
MLQEIYDKGWVIDNIHVVVVVVAAREAKERMPNPLQLVYYGQLVYNRMLWFLSLLENFPCHAVGYFFQF